MKNIKRLVGAALIAVFAVSTVGCSMIEKTPEAINNTVLAKVGKVDITRARLNESMKDVIDQLKQTYGEDYTKNTEAIESYKSQATSHLDSVITEEVLLQKAQALNLVPDLSKMDEEVNKELETIKNNYFQGDQKKLEEGIAMYGYTMDSLKEQIKDQLTNQKDQVSENRAYLYLIKDVTVTDEEIQDYYDKNKDASYTIKPGAQLSHILVDSEEKAKEIKSKIDKGAKFEDMAAQYGTDSTKDTGGSLGYYAYDTEELDKDFMEGAKKLKEGEVSQPVKTQFGYHIIKATNINTETKVQPLDAVKDQIKSTLLQQKQQDEFTKKLDEWKKDLKVKTYPNKL